MKEFKIDIEEGKIADINEKNLTIRPFEENLEEKVDAFLGQFVVSPTVSIYSTWRLKLHYEK